MTDVQARTGQQLTALERLKRWVELMTVSQLRIALDELGLAKGGLKGSMQQRLLGAVGDAPRAVPVLRVLEVVRKAIDAAPSTRTPAGCTESRQGPSHNHNQANTTHNRQPYAFHNNGGHNHHHHHNQNHNNQNQNLKNPQQQQQQPQQQTQTQLNPQPPPPTVVFNGTPFFTFKKRLSSPTFTDHRSTSLAIRFDAKEYLTLKESKETSVNLGLRLFVGRYTTETANKIQIEYPDTVSFYVNSNQVPHNAFMGLRKKPHTARPLDLTPYLNRNDPQTLRFDYVYSPHTYVAVVTLVEHVAFPDMIKHLSANNRITKEQVLDKRQRMAEEDGIEATLEQVSLKDPQSKCRIICPVRSTNCTHIQCFDCDTFLTLNANIPTWECPQCFKPAPFDTLLIDGYFEEILRDAGDVENVDVLPDGTWKLPAPTMPPGIFGSPSQLSGCDDKRRHKSLPIPMTGQSQQVPSHDVQRPQTQMGDRASSSANESVLWILDDDEVEEEEELIDGSAVTPATDGGDHGIDRSQHVGGRVSVGSSGGPASNTGFSTRNSFGRKTGRVSDIMSFDLSDDASSMSNMSSSPLVVAFSRTATAQAPATMNLSSSSSSSNFVDLTLSDSEEEEVEMATASVDPHNHSDKVKVASSERDESDPLRVQAVAPAADRGIKHVIRLPVPPGVHEPVYQSDAPPPAPSLPVVPLPLSPSGSSSVADAGVAAAAAYTSDRGEPNLLRYSDLVDEVPLIHLVNASRHMSERQQHSHHESQSMRPQTNQADMPEPASQSQYGVEYQQHDCDRGVNRESREASHDDRRRDYREGGDNEHEEMPRGYHHHDSRSQLLPYRHGRPSRTPSPARRSADERGSGFRGHGRVRSNGGSPMLPGREGDQQRQDPAIAQGQDAVLPHIQNIRMMLDDVDMRHQDLMSRSYPNADMRSNLSPRRGLVPPRRRHDGNGDGRLRYVDTDNFDDRRHRDRDHDVPRRKRRLSDSWRLDTDEHDRWRQRVHPHDAPASSSSSSFSARRGMDVGNRHHMSMQDSIRASSVPAHGSRLSGYLGASQHSSGSKSRPYASGISPLQPTQQQQNQQQLPPISSIHSQPPPPPGPSHRHEATSLFKPVPRLYSLLPQALEPSGSHPSSSSSMSSPLSEPVSFLSQARFARDQRAPMVLRRPPSPPPPQLPPPPVPPLSPISRPQCPPPQLQFQPQPSLSTSSSSSSSTLSTPKPKPDSHPSQVVSRLLRYMQS